jgi:hypothetical protein
MEPAPGSRTTRSAPASGAGGRGTSQETSTLENDVIVAICEPMLDARKASMQPWCFVGFAGSGRSPQTLQAWSFSHQSPSYTVCGVRGANPALEMRSDAAAPALATTASARRRAESRRISVTISG